jgi:hypothetical protein
MLILPHLKGLTAGSIGSAAFKNASLDLKFADNKSLVDAITGSNLVTFTRASTGTFVGSDGLIQSAATNVPRFDHNPTTGESLGLLVEEARTNLATYSEQINDASWTKQDATVTVNSAVSPDNTTTADLIYPSTTGSIRYVTKSFGISSSITTMSFFVKASGFTRCYLLGGTTSLAAWFDLSAGTVGTVTANCSATIQSFANGWFRCSLTQPALTSPYISIGPCDANNSFVATASSTNGIFVWGAQLEAGSFPTSYIPTVASTVTRAADVASITGANFSSWYNATQGTLLAFQRSLAGQDAYQTATFGLSSNNTTTQFIAIEATNDYNRFYVYGNGNTAINNIYAPVTPGTLTKDALAYANNDVAAVRNGGTVATDTSVGIPIASIDRAGLGYDVSFGLQKQKTIARLAYYPVRLANTTLQAITQ